MNHTQITLPVKGIVATIMLLVVMTSFTSCARKLRFNTSSVVPAAEGTVKVKTDGNNNYNIKLSLSNLAAPDRLQPPKRMYIVWAETDDYTPRNIGQINTSTGFLSGKLKADFETVSATKPKRIFITAEDDASVQYPDARVVLSTNRF